MTEVVCLDPAYSTTRALTRAQPALSADMGARVERILFLPPRPDRSGEGGLRLAGYFKAASGASAGEIHRAGGGSPLITVITVAFNAARTLERTINSVIGQSYSNVEYLVIDAGSTDGTLEILQRYSHMLDYWVSEPDAGIYDAWNKGVRLACGEWLAFVGADDVYLPDALERYAGSIAADSGTPEYVSSRVNLTAGSQVLRTIGRPWTWRGFRKYMTVAHVGSLHRRSLYEQYGLYDTGYRSSGDYEFLLRARRGLRAAYVDAVTANMDIGGSSDNNVRVLWETERAKRTSGGRSAVMSLLERIMAMGRWKLRRWFWY